VALDIHGMQRLEVVPIASDNRIRLSSTWQHPGFIGDFLAAKRTVTDEGFQAEWTVNGLATSAQQTFRQKASSGLQTLGVDLIDTISPYPMTDRALKYGFLFIFLTFGAFFLFELLHHLQIHPIQYGFVGLAQAIFFLLLLGLSEHMRFGLSYLIAVGACISVITFYLSGVLRNQRHGLAFGGLLALLYGSLYGLLQSEDHALVAGSVLLFGLLAGVMILTRNIDWYAISARRVRQP
jgi:inner membrane protein